MQPEIRILGLGTHLPGPLVSNEELAPRLGMDADSLRRDTGIEGRHFTPSGEGPSDLAVVAARSALAAADTTVDDLGLMIFATTTPDVAFPGAACFLQEKLGVPTIGALDIRAQSAGFVAGLDLAAGFCAEVQADGSADARYRRVLLATGEVFASGLDFSPAGREMAGRLADGAAVAIVGPGDQGPRLLGARWYTDGTLLESFWTEVARSSKVAGRVTREDIEEGRHFPHADLPSLRAVAATRMAEVAREVAEIAGFTCSEAARVLIDYIEPDVAEAVAAELGIATGKLVVPTAKFGHIMTAGLAIALADVLPELVAGDKVLLVAAGSGFTWGAAALEVGR